MRTFSKIQWKALLKSELAAVLASCYLPKIKEKVSNQAEQLSD